SGGVIDGSVVSATTDTQADTQALIQDHGSSPDKGVKARIIDVSALHTAEFNTEIDSTGAGVLHMSAARSDQSVDSNTLAGTGDSAHLQAANISIHAKDDIRKPKRSKYNVKAAGGGAISG